jgi:ribosomal-protein-alanine N-acetyltransferase
MILRPYEKRDKNQLLNLLRLNTPQYFAEEEEADFSFYLDKKLEQYFVVEEEGIIIASGGINYFFEANLARISWDMVNPTFQGKGVGKKLTIFRIEEIKKNPAIKIIQVRTTQYVFKFL